MNRTCVDNPAGHDGDMTLAAWPVFGPQPRDELADLTTARLSTMPLPAPPAMAAAPAPGAFEIVDGRGVYVRRVEGPVDATPAWYIHGLGGSSTNWTRLAAVLAATNPGYIVDLPGSGRSDPPPRGRYSVTDDADLVAALIRRVSGGPVHLLGNSMGGVVATALAARHRDLVSSLTLISPAVPDLRLGRDRGADARLAVVMVPGITSAAERRLAAVDAMARARGMAVVCFGDPAGVTEEDLEVAAADLAWRSGLPWALRSTIFSLRALIRSYLRPGRWSFAAAARAVRVPTLVMWGTRDKLVDVRLAQPTSALFPDGRLLVIAGSGHVAQMEHPGLTAAAVAALWEDADAAPRIGRHPAAPTTGAPQPNRDPAVATSTA